MTEDSETSLGFTRIAPEGADPSSWCYLLHGIYGSGRNWATVARRVVGERPDWGFILVDLRLHGDSLGFSGPHTVRACVDDLLALEATLELPPRAIVGHSFGGKVALLRAERGDGSLRQVWVADSSLEPQPPGGTAWQVLEIVKELPSEFARRDDLVDALVARGLAAGLGQWLAMNLERRGEAYGWKLDWSGVEELLRDYYATDAWHVIEDPPAGIEIHIVRANQSSSLDPVSLGRIVEAAQMGKPVHLHDVDAGHWLNVDNPDAIISLLVAQLPRQ